MRDRKHYTRKRKFNAYSFAVHGNHRLIAEGKVIHCYLEGAFNLEGVFHICQSLERAIDGLGKWALYIHTTSCTVATPEAEYHAKTKLSALSQYGCIGMVFQTKNVLMKRLSSKVASQIHIPFFASDNQDALEQFTTPFQLSR